MVKEPLFWFKGNSVAPSAIVNVDGFKEELKVFYVYNGNVPASRKALHHWVNQKNY